MLKNQILADKVDKFAEKFWWKSNFIPWDTKSNSTHWNKKINNVWEDIEKVNTLNWTIKLWEEIPDKMLKKLEDNLWTKNNLKLNIKILSDKTKIVLEQNWINIDEIKWHRITSNWVQHILKRHWEKAELSPWEIPVTIKDIKLIPKIIKNPDKVTVSWKKNKRWETVIIYEKTIGNKYYYLENINKKSGYIETQTMYIN